MFLSTVSATNTDTNDNLTSTSDEIVLESNNQDSNILTDPNTSSFDDLNTKIQETSEGSTLILDKNYTYNKQTDSAYIDGISVNKTLTIVSYWNNGEKNTQVTIIDKNAKKDVGIILKLFDDDFNLLYEYSGFTDSNGVISFSGWNKSSYHVVVCHETGSSKAILYEFDLVYLVYASADGNGTGFSKSSPTNLSNALSICEDGGVIFLSGGVYNIAETLNISKSVTIVGSGEDTILDGGNSNRILTVTADNVTVCNVTFINGNADEGGAVYWTGKNGLLNNTCFYNNTASSGSAIYAAEELKIYNSVFLDNLAEVEFTYTKSDDGFTVHMVSHDDYINAIYVAKALSVIQNVTYFGTNGIVTNSNTIDAMVAHNVTVVLSHKINQTEIISYTDVTDSNGNITKSDLAKNIYYEATIKHFTGLNKYRSILFDIPVNVTVSKLELYVPDNLEVGDNLTVVALVNSTAYGRVNFTINGEVLGVVDVVDGRAYLSVDPSFGLGDYELVAVYIPDDGSDYYGQRNTTNFTVKVKYSPFVVVIVPDISTNNSELFIQINSNFGLNQ